MILSEDEFFFRAKVSPESARKIRRARVYFDFREEQDRLLAGGTFITGGKRTMVEPYCCFGMGNNVIQMGGFSYARRELPKNLIVGRYCSIGPGLLIPVGTHPISYISTSPFTYDKPFSIFETALKDRGVDNFPVYSNPQRSSPVLGNDVWIGENVTLMPGVNIGDGAVLASGSMIAKDVPPYAIVAGNPGVVKRLRFKEDVVERLIKLKWWRFHFSDFKGLSLDVPSVFCDGLEERIQDKSIEPWTPNLVNVYSIIKNK